MTWVDNGGIKDCIRNNGQTVANAIDRLTAAVEANTAAVQESARTPQRFIHVPGPGERGGHHADSRPAVPAALRQR
jgi:hypothetical protein